MSKQKLTIEHLAPYLPYGVKCSNNKKSYLQIGKDRIGVLQQISVNDDSLILNEGGYFLVHYSEVIPILRPLSDLKHDYVFRELYFLIGGGYKSYETFKKSQLDNYLYTPPEMWSYKVLKLFLSLHVDLFGLIEKELAININDLKDE